MMIRSFLAIGLFSLAAPAAAASLVGSSMDVSYRFPDIDTVYVDGNPSVSPFVVGAGIESTVNVEDVTFIDVDFGASSLIITFNTTLSNPTWNITSFNGLLFEGPGAGLIASATVVFTDMTGFDDSRILLSGGRLGLNWNGLSYQDGDTIEIAFGLVPEASTWAMLIAGFGLVGAAARRRRPAHA
jgi:hypothetical protein